MYQNFTPYISIFGNVYSKVKKNKEIFFDVLNETYSNNNNLTTDKLNSKAITQGIFSQNDVERKAEHVERWSGVMIFDIDLSKTKVDGETFNPKDFYKSNKDSGFNQRVDKAVEILFDYFSEKWKLNAKLSASGIGIHFFMVFDVDHLTDQESKDYHKALFSYYKQKYDDFISEELLYNNITDIKFEIDNVFSGLHQPLALTQSKKFKFEYRNVIDTQATNGLYNSATQTQQNNIQNKAVYKPSGTTYSNDDIETLKGRFKDLISNLNTRIESYTNRITVVNTLVYLNFDESIIDILMRHDKKTKKTQWSSYFKTAKNKVKTYDTSNIQTAFFILKNRSDSKVYHDFGINSTSGLNTNNDIKQPDFLEVEQYISDKNKEIKSYLKDNYKVLLTAPTGSGKSRFSVDLLKEYHKHNTDKYCVICVDTIALAKQIETEYNIWGIYGEKTMSGTTPDYPGVYVTTYDSLKHFNKIDFLILDEAHQLVAYSSFKKNVISRLFALLQSIERVICITATPDYLYFLDDFKKLEIKVKNKLTFDYQIVDRGEADNIRNILGLIGDLSPQKGQKAVVYHNSIKGLEKIREYLNVVFPDLKVVIIESELNSNEKLRTTDDYRTLKSIQNQNIIPPDIDIVLMTSILQNGVNILNDDIQYCISTEIEKTNLIQFSARFRKGIKNKIYLIPTPHKEKNKVLKILGCNEYKAILKKYNSICYQYNKSNKEKESEIELSKNNIEAIEYDSINHEYVVNKMLTAYEVYSTNRYVYRANPGFFLPESHVILSGTNSYIINESTYDLIDLYFKEKNKKNREFYFKDNNSEIINKAIETKSHKKKKMEIREFIEDNGLILSETNIKYLNREYRTWKNLLSDFNMGDDLNINELMLSKNSAKWVRISCIFNYLVYNYEVDKEKAKDFFNKTYTKDEPLIQWLWCIREKFEKSKKYTWDEIKEIGQEIWDSKKFSIFKIGNIKDNDNFLKHSLESVFTVNKKRGNNNGNRFWYHTFSDWKNPEGFEKVFNRLDIHLIEL